MALYEMCDENSQKMLDIPANAEVDMLLTGDVWCCISYQGQQGYCPTEQLDVRKSNE